MDKVILVSVDGMRPDVFLSGRNPFAEKKTHLDFYTAVRCITGGCHRPILIISMRHLNGKGSL